MEEGVKYVMQYLSNTKPLSVTGIQGILTSKYIQYVSKLHVYLTNGLNHF